jgi:hypothetical protein
MFLDTTRKPAEDYGSGELLSRPAVSAHERNGGRATRAWNNGRWH